MKLLGRRISDWLLIGSLAAIEIGLIVTNTLPMAVCVALVLGMAMGVSQPHADDL